MGDTGTAWYCRQCGVYHNGDCPLPDSYFEPYKCQDSETGVNKIIELLIEILAQIKRQSADKGEK